MKVKITKDCIKNAVKRDSHRCMIADAVRAAVPDARYISVDLQSIRWSNMKSGKRFTAFTPRIGQHKLLDFDQGHSVQPFEMEVTPVSTRKVGWKPNHPTSSRKGKKYKSTGKKVYRARKERQFGLRMFAV